MLKTRIRPEPHNKPLKQCIMQQKVIALNEFLAKIHPHSLIQRQKLMLSNQNPDKAQKEEHMG